ncbi:hypothetical protein F4777DRAFT_552948 [Nemania sp. FL0916]|nr:hypothetical protein F4777DRAFT_552948 [Nemania sp. FL0916]
MTQRKLRWETELLLRREYVDIEPGDSSAQTPLVPALSPSSGSSDTAALLLTHGAQVLSGGNAIIGSTIVHCYPTGVSSSI